MELQDLLPDLPDYDPEPADGLRVGDSPVPGVILKRIFRNYSITNRLVWSPDGRLLAAPCNSFVVKLWSVSSAMVRNIRGHGNTVFSAAWSPNGNMLASSSKDRSVHIWNPHSGKVLRVLDGHHSSVLDVKWSPLGDRILAASRDMTISVWDNHKKLPLRRLINHGDAVWALAFSSDGRFLASAGNGYRIVLSALDNHYRQFGQLIGHRGLVTCIRWVPGSNLLVSGGADHSVRVWDTHNRTQLRVLEAHTDAVQGVDISANGDFLATTGIDNQTIIWRTEDWTEICVLEQNCSRKSKFRSVAFHPTLPILASLGEDDRTVFIWEIESDKLLGQNSTRSVQYTTAKVVLVGDSGVGKTGLGWRLAHGEFKEHASTHGQQFWVIDELGNTRDDGTVCEAVMWDLAGQHVYRQVHSIFLDNVDASLVLFDPTNRQEPLKGAEFWLQQLKNQGELPPSILVGARMDRGGSTLTIDELGVFCQRNKISGGFIATSAKVGSGLDTLLEALKKQISWDTMTTTVTTVTFKRIKDFVLNLKEAAHDVNILLSPERLRNHLRESDLDWQFTDAEMMTAVGHLETHGYITILTSSSGETHILLTPDLLVTLASSIVLLADKNPRELGAISETELLEDRYEFGELVGLEKNERRILLDAAILRFLEHSICFRETFNTDTLLIFPGLIKQKRPLNDDIFTEDDVSYVVRGRVENLYSVLVVMLGYTPTFVRINQWQNQAQYETGKNQICGFRLIADREGEIELVLYYSDQMPNSGRRKFMELFEEFLYQRDVEIERFPPAYCRNDHLLDRVNVVGRLRSGKDFAFCPECGDRVGLPLIDRPGLSTGAAPWLKREEAVARLRSTYETMLAHVKSFRRDFAVPRCYLSFAPQQREVAARLKNDLQDAGILIIDSPSRVTNDDCVVLLDTPDYQYAFRHPTIDFVPETELIKKHLLLKNSFLSITLEDSSREQVVHSIDKCVVGDFTETTHYPASLFDLVLRLYSIPIDLPAFAERRETLHLQWEETLATLPQEDISMLSAPNIFISYSHQDEPFKNELVTMLGSLQRRNVIDAWHDRRIKPGEEWYPTIQKAMNESDIALFLISPDFLASGFISKHEVPPLLERRIEDGMLVVPIIVRACMWDSEPVIKDLQALPQNAQPVIEFSKENGDRDKVWKSIASFLKDEAEKLRKAK